LIEVITAIIIRHEHNSSKDNQTAHSLRPAAQGIKNSQDQHYQERTCGQYEIVLQDVEARWYLRPINDHSRAKWKELMQSGSTYDRKHQKQPDKTCLISGGRLNKLQCAGKLPDIKADDAD
jgi:hypothetical protein